jgi:hypothetical protein
MKQSKISGGALEAHEQNRCQQGAQGDCHGSKIKFKIESGKPNPIAFQNDRLDSYRRKNPFS